MYKIAIITAEYNPDLTKPMLEASRTELESLEAEVRRIAWVPGVLDMPLIVKKLLKREDIDGAVVLGAVIRGDSDHDQIVANNAVSKLKDVELLIEKPIGFGIIGPGITKALAQERIESYAKHAAQTVIKQLKNVESVKC